MVVSYARGQAQKLRREAEYSRKLEEEVRERTSELAERNRELQLAKKKFEEASFTDSLTGIKNRRFLINTIDRDIATVERFYSELEGPIGELPEDRPDILFLLFDLDGFKTVNDTYGHAAGDLVLIQVRDLLEQACRRSDTLIRWGGDEFLVVCHGSDLSMAEGLAERIRSSVAEHEFDVGNGRPMRLTCSIGFAHLPFVPARPKLLGWEQVVNVADRALYLAKEKGRDGWAGLSSNPSIARVADEDLVTAVTDSTDTLLAEGLLLASSSYRSERVRAAAGSRPATVPATPTAAIIAGRAPRRRGNRRRGPADAAPPRRRNPDAGPAGRHRTAAPPPSGLPAPAPHRAASSGPASTSLLPGSRT